MRVLPLIVALSVLVGTCHASEPLESTVDDLGWIAGHWRAEHGDMVVEEGWIGPSGGSMLGVNRTVASERTAAFEYLRLEVSEGGVVMLASPGGRCPATPFHLVELVGQRAVFANPEHDFPQRIIYHRENDRLTTAIEGQVDGEERRAEWRFELLP